MADTTLQLAKSGSAVFNASGIAVVSIQNGSLARWEVKLLNINTTSDSDTKCLVYRGQVSTRNQIDATEELGNTNTSPTDVTVMPGDVITARWENGTPGAIATFIIEGDEILKGRRSYG